MDAVRGADQSTNIIGFSFPRKVGRKSNKEKNIIKFFVTKGKFKIYFYWKKKKKNLKTDFHKK